MTSSDESDWSSDEDDDGSLEGGFDDSVCPPGCDQVTIPDVWTINIDQFKIVLFFS